HPVSLHVALPISPPGHRRPRRRPRRKPPRIGDGHGSAVGGDQNGHRVRPQHVRPCPEAGRPLRRPTLRGGQHPPRRPLLRQPLRPAGLQVLRLPGRQSLNRTPATSTHHPSPFAGGTACPPRPTRASRPSPSPSGPWPVSTRPSAS